MHYGWETISLKDHHDNLPKWLTSPGNLTQKLRHVGNHTLTLLKQGEAEFSEEERQLLQQTSTLGYTRHIIHHLDSYIAVCARTIVSQSFYHKYQTAFETLGTKPLGQTILYHRDNIKRSLFEYGSIKPSSFLTTHFPESINQASKLLARRSIFQEGKDNMCITEIFLPIMNEYEPPK